MYCGGGRRPLPRTCHPGWMRRNLSKFQPRLLWLLRADGKSQYTVRQQPVPDSRPKRPADCAGFSRIQRLGVAVPQGQRGVRTVMSDRAAKSRTIKVDYLARVEGEGALFVKLKGERVTDVKLKIFEPPRLFEAFLRGRHFSETPDLVSRICGICPVAYQMSAVHAIERALGVTIDPAVRLLRRLFYCGEWIESHALHIFMLHTPDFLGYQDVIEMARDHRSVVEQALRLKKIGNRIITLLGGREIHPVSAAVGGFYKTPARNQLQALKADLEWGLEASLDTVKLVAGFEFPDFEQDYEFVALSHPEEYPFNEGRLVSNRGLNIDAAEYEDHFVEQHVKH